jgi:hypothetical protein
MNHVIVCAASACRIVCQQTLVRMPTLLLPWMVTRHPTTVAAAAPGAAANIHGIAAASTAAAGFAADMHVNTAAVAAAAAAAAVSLQRASLATRLAWPAPRTWPLPLLLLLPTCTSMPLLLVTCMSMLLLLLLVVLQCRFRRLFPSCKVGMVTAKKVAAATAAAAANMHVNAAAACAAVSLQEALPEYEVGMVSAKKVAVVLQAGEAPEMFFQNLEGA